MPDLVRQFEAETPEFLRPFVPRSSYTEKALNVMIAKLVKEGHLSRKDWDYYDSLCDERVVQMGGRLPHRGVTTRRINVRHCCKASFGVSLTPRSICKNPRPSSRGFLLFFCEITSG